MGVAENKKTMVETISSLSTVLYAITFLFIINEAKKKDLKNVKAAMKNPLWPRTKLSTIYDFYRIYYNAKGFNLVLILNLFCFSVTIIGLIIIIFDY
jgi:hypothetical protein